jgi:hypothetical protein
VTVAFTSPADGAEIHAGDPIALSASVTRKGGSLDDLDYAWTIQPGGELEGSQTVSEDGVRLALDEVLAAGDYTAALTVSDGGGHQADDQVTFTVTEDEKPRVTLREPDDDGVYPDSLPLVVEVKVRDDDDAVQDIVLVWGGCLEGYEDVPTQVDTTGYAFFSVEFLPLGETKLTVEGFDPSGASDKDKVTFEIVTGDVDGDGYTDEELGGNDCDDADAEVNPGAEEVKRNGKDDDCDGEAD